jgi:type IV pilus assembly protein PilO
MRILIGLLLAANLVVAVIAFHPFGGSADDLQRQQRQLTAQLSQLRNSLDQTKKHVLKVQTARVQGDKFLAEYFMDAGSASAAIVEDLDKMRTDAGIKMGQASFERQPIEGSDTLVMLATQVGFEGTYANFTKFINLLDKSPRFLIIDSMTASAPQGQNGQQLNVSLKILAFIRESPGGAI